MLKQRSVVMLLTLIMLLVLISATLPAMVRQLLPPLPGVRTPVTAGAVVVLGGGRRFAKGQAVLTTRSLQRLQVAAKLAEEQQLPLLLSGGRGGRHAGPEQPSEAALMAELVRQRWPQLTLWLEQDSRNTWENACFSVPLLVQRGIQGVLLVSDRSHLPRAVWSFKRQGMQAQPAWASPLPSPAWVPSAGALSLLPEIWYEWAALAWYWLTKH